METIQASFECSDLENLDILLEMRLSGVAEQM
jgi:hypothetical protein